MRDLVFWICVKTGSYFVPVKRSSLPQPPGHATPYGQRASTGRKCQTHIMASWLLWWTWDKSGREEAWLLCVLQWGQYGAVHIEAFPSSSSPTTTPSGWFTAAQFGFRLAQHVKAARVAALSLAAVPGPPQRPGCLLPHTGSCPSASHASGAPSSSHRRAGKWAEEGEPSNKPRTNKHKEAEITGKYLTVAKPHH